MTEKFIEKAINIHGNKYDYSTKVIIICKIHGEFLQGSYHYRSTLLQK
jgi:hypothetical protein